MFINGNYNPVYKELTVAMLAILQKEANRLAKEIEIID
jgi:hypothetical protein